jgi:D-alanyl-D-alanine carboxypeptidase (penicillin-binding protein 5/6)
MRPRALASLALLAALLPGGGALASGEPSLLLVDHADGRVLAAENEGAPRQVASLAKIATALVLLEWLDEAGLDPATSHATVPPEALRGGANPLGLRAGDRLSYETGLYAAMMASDNTSAHAMAEAAGLAIAPGAPPGRGVAVFVARMNDLAFDLGMKDTRFVNPHGLDEGGELGVSTAADIARLALRALDRPGFLAFASERERTVRFQRGEDEVAVKLANTNELLGTRGVDGLKTGTTRLAGPCLVATATREIERGGRREIRRLVSVVLGAEDRFRETALLLDRGWAALADGRKGEQIDPKQRLRGGGG